MITEPELTLSRALAYARLGWPVFPCRPGGKESATTDGCRDAATDPDQITYWWNRQPAANLAIATGTPGRGLHFYFAGSRQSCGRLPRLHLDFRAALGDLTATATARSGSQPR